MAQQGWQEKCLGVAGLTRKVLWHSGAEKKSVLALRGCQEKGFYIAGLARKVFWCCGADKKSVLVLREK